MPSSNANTSATSPAPKNFLNVMVILLSVDGDGAGLESGGVGFAGADAHGVFEAEDEDLAVADLAGLGSRGDGFDGLVDLVGGDCDLNLDLGQEAHGVFGA